MLIIASALLSFDVLGGANFEVTSFSCSPSEVVINSVFSCTAKILNSAGDGSSGSVGTATLYPDASNWLDNSNYPQASGELVADGKTIDITFTGLKAVKSGNNGFSKIMLDLVEDKYVVNQNKKVNVINVAVTVSNSASSAAMGSSVTSTAEITAGGNIDVSLTFVSNSGGCSIGSQTNPKSFTGLTDGSKQSWAWTVTQGTIGTCQYTLSASATSSGGYASKIDSTSSTITCTNCPTPPSGGAATSGGGGGGGSATKIYALGEMTSTQSVELAAKEAATFNISGTKHTLNVLNVTETTAKITIESNKQTFTLTVGDEINVDLNSDNLAEISVQLQTINIITKKAKFLIIPLLSGEKKAPTTGAAGGVAGGEEEKKSGKKMSLPPLLAKDNLIYGLIIFFIIIAAISVTYLIKRKRDRRWGRRI